MDSVKLRCGEKPTIYSISAHSISARQRPMRPSQGLNSLNSRKPCRSKAGAGISIHQPVPFASSGLPFCRQLRHPSAAGLAVAILVRRNGRSERGQVRAVGAGLGGLVCAQFADEDQRPGVSPGLSCSRGRATNDGPGAREQAACGTSRAITARRLRGKCRALAYEIFRAYCAGDA